MNYFSSWFVLEFMQLCEAVSFFIRKNVNKEGVYGLGEVMAMEIPFNLFLFHIITLHGYYTHPYKG